LQSLAREVAASGDEIVVVSNKPIDTQAPLPAHVGFTTGIASHSDRLDAMRPPPRSLPLQPDVAHFTNGMIPSRRRRRPWSRSTT
jgi:hypothetical protein